MGISSLQMVGAVAGAAGLGASFAFANDFSVQDMNTEGHHETGYAVIGGAAAVASRLIPARVNVPVLGEISHAARGVLLFAGVGAAAWFAGSAFADYASVSERLAPAAPTKPPGLPTTPAH